MVARRCGKDGGVCAVKNVTVVSVQAVLSAGDNGLAVPREVRKEVVVDVRNPGQPAEAEDLNS